jgi:WhiB family redox-sensing transcriptional regulator
MNIPDFTSKGPANCKGHEDPDLFFPEPYQLGSREISEKAKKVCDGCEYRTECLSWALVNDEPGVWGGMSENERRLLKKKAAQSGRRLHLPLRPVDESSKYRSTAGSRY